MSRLTAKRLFAVEAMAVFLLVEQWIGLDEAEKFSRYIAVTSITYLSSAFLYLIGLSCAEECIRRGARVRIALPIALIAVSLLGALIQTVLWFEWSWRRERSVVLFVVEQAVELGLWAALGVFVYWNRMRSVRLNQNVQQAQWRRAQMERSLVTSRLEAARAQIDAPAVFAELASIRDSLRRDEVQSVAALDDLIQRLRESRARALAMETEGYTS